MSDPTPTIVFVDDEPDVLAGIRSALRRERKRFDLQFAESGPEAIEILREQDVAVLVSDMRMPVMTGAELLHQAREISPATVRIVLTGEAEAELVMRAIHVAHQWLSKPCQADQILRGIEAALRYRSFLVDPAIRAAVGRIGALPSPPSRYTRLVELMQSVDVPVSAIADEIGSDPAVAAKVIHLANSAFSGAAPVVDLTAGVTRVGLETLAHLVLSAELHRPWDDTSILPGVDIETLAEMSVHAAVVAQEAAAPEHTASARLAALLHNVGLIVEAQEAPEQLAADHDLAVERGTSLARTQRAEHGVSYVDLGAHLLSMWGLPTETVLAVAAVADDEGPDDGDLARAVRLGVNAARRRYADRLSPPMRVTEPTNDGGEPSATDNEVPQP